MPQVKIKANEYVIKYITNICDYNQIDFGLLLKMKPKDLSLCVFYIYIETHCT